MFFLIESILILIQISLNVRLEINHHWVKVMAWCRQATSHYLNQCCPVLLGLINAYLMQVDQNWSDRVCWTKTTLAVCASVPHTYGTRSLIVIIVAAGALAPVGSMPSTVSMLTNELGIILSKLSLPTSDFEYILLITYLKCPTRFRETSRYYVNWMIENWKF